MIGAEVEHAGAIEKGGSRNSRRLGSAVVELAGGRRFDSALASPKIT
jgi:hypothetical protein